MGDIYDYGDEKHKQKKNRRVYKRGFARRKKQFQVLK